MKNDNYHTMDSENKTKKKKIFQKQNKKICV